MASREDPSPDTDTAQQLPAAIQDSNPASAHRAFWRFCPVKSVLGLLFLVALCLGMGRWVWGGEAQKEQTDSIPSSPAPLPDAVRTPRASPPPHLWEQAFHTFREEFRAQQARFQAFMCLRQDIHLGLPFEKSLQHLIHLWPHPLLEKLEPFARAGIQSLRQLHAELQPALLSDAGHITLSPSASHSKKLSGWWKSFITWIKSLWWVENKLSAADPVILNDHEADHGATELTRILSSLRNDVLRGDVTRAINWLQEHTDPNTPRVQTWITQASHYAKAIDILEKILDEISLLNPTKDTRGSEL